jgi:hypothetical protein
MSNTKEERIVNIGSLIDEMLSESTRVKIASMNMLRLV